MRKLILLGLLAASAAAHAQVVQIPSGPFLAPPPLTENFDSILPGSYLSQPIWSAPAVGNVFALGPGTVDIMAPIFPPPLTAPNTCVGTGTDLGISVGPPPMRRFGAFFRSRVNSTGVGPGFAKVVFIDASGLPIGSAGVVLTNSFVWWGWKVNPKFNAIEIFGSSGPGDVELDNIEASIN